MTPYRPVMGRCQASSYNCLGHSKLKKFRLRFTRTRASAKIPSDEEQLLIDREKPFG
jgi:hypothetical protein